MVVAVIVVGVGWVQREHRQNQLLLGTANHLLALEFDHGDAGSQLSRSMSAAYHPFRRWIIPGSGAAKFTHWQLQQSVNAGPDALTPRTVHWWTRRAPVISKQLGYTMVRLNVYWSRTFSPTGMSTGTAEVGFQLEHTRSGWRAENVFWHSDPGQGPNEPDSFQYDFQDLFAQPAPPQSDPPYLKPQVNNP